MAVRGGCVAVSTRPFRVIRPRRSGTSPAMASRMVVLPAPEGPNRASRSPGAADRAACTRKSLRSTSTSASSTGAPDVGGQRQRQRDNQQDQRERQGGRQPGLLQRGEDLHRYAVGVVGNDNDRAERAHSPGPGD